MLLMPQAQKISTDGLRWLNKSFNVLFLWMGLFLELASVHGSQTGKETLPSLFGWTTCSWDFGHSVQE